MKKTICVVLIFVFLFGAIYSGFQIYEILREYRVGEKMYTDTQQFISVQPSKNEIAPTEPDALVQEQLPQDETIGFEETTPTEPKPDITFPEVDFEGLMQISTDVVGWIYIEGTNINYPVVQGKDNRYYISALIDGTPNGAGSIFMDYRNASDFSDYNTVLYGHNMKNKTMFHDICNYRTQEYYEAHPIGLIMTPEKNYYFEIISGYVASLTDSAWQIEFADETDAHQWLQGSMERSLFISYADPTSGDKAITLSTCSYEYANARFVLVGILKEYD